MRGRIIHYNSNDGRGLISDGSRQYPFEVADWHSATAPTLNAVVEFEVAGDRPVAVTRVPGEALLREHATSLAGRVGELARDGGGPQTIASGAVARLGRPLLAAHAGFVIGALTLTFVRVDAMGMGRDFTLTGVSELAASGFAVSGGAWVWLALLSPLLPVVWRSRWAFAALALPLIAVIRPWLAIRSALSQMAEDIGAGIGGEYAARLAESMGEMVEFGAGAWLCALCATALAALGLLRALRTRP